MHDHVSVVVHECVIKKSLMTGAIYDKEKHADDGT